MRIEVLDRYKRRGRVCHFTFRLTLDEPRKSEDGEAYSITFAWAYLEWGGWQWDRPQWTVKSMTTHTTFPPLRAPTFQELLIALEGTASEARAIDAIKKGEKK